MKGHLYRKIQPEGWWIAYVIEGWTNRSEIKLKIGEHIPQDIMGEVIDDGYAEVDFKKEWSFDHECYYATLYPKTQEELQPTWDDVRKAIELAQTVKDYGDYKPYTEEQIIEQLKNKIK